MILLRAIVGVLSFGAAACLAFQAAVMFQPVILPTIREFKHESTYFHLLRVGPLSLSGWQILFFEAALVTLAMGFLVLGVCALSSNSKE